MDCRQRYQRSIAESAARLAKFLANMQANMKQVFVRNRNFKGRPLTLQSVMTLLVGSVEYLQAKTASHTDRIATHVMIDSDAAYGWPWSPLLYVAYPSQTCS